MPGEFSEPRCPRSRTRILALRGTLWFGDKAELRYLSQVVPDAPVLGDLAVGQPEPVDVLDGETLVRWGNAGRGGGGEWQGVPELHRARRRPAAGARTDSCDGQLLRTQERVGRTTRRRREHDTLLFLPPYPPNINPMEEVSAKVKSISRKVSAQTTEALLEATGSALDAITPEDIRGDHTSTADTVYPCNRCENRLTAICGEVDPCAIMGG